MTLPTLLVYTETRGPATKRGTGALIDFRHSFPADLKPCCPRKAGLRAAAPGDP